jgi:hypothetical protein
MKAACDAFSNNLGADDLTAWIEANVETPVVLHFSGKWEGKWWTAAGDTGSDSENNIDDSCEVMVPKLSKVNKILMKFRHG